MPLNDKLNAKNVQELYEQKYQNEKLITIRRDVPGLADIEGKQGWSVGGFQVHSDGDRAVVVGGLDNLLKGAATQCLQVRFFSLFFLAFGLLRLGYDTDLLCRT